MQCDATITWWCVTNLVLCVSLPLQRQEHRKWQWSHPSELHETVSAWAVAAFRERCRDGVRSRPSLYVEGRMWRPTRTVRGHGSQWTPPRPPSATAPAAGVIYWYDTRHSVERTKYNTMITMTSWDYQHKHNVLFLFRSDLSNETFRFNDARSGPARYTIFNYQKVQDYTYDWMPVGNYFSELLTPLVFKWADISFPHLHTS